MFIILSQFNHPAPLIDMRYLSSLLCLAYKYLFFFLDGRRSKPPQVSSSMLKPPGPVALSLAPPETKNVVKPKARYVPWELPPDFVKRDVFHKKTQIFKKEAIFLLVKKISKTSRAFVVEFSTARNKDCSETKG